MISVIPHIQSATADYYGIPIRTFLGESRLRHIARPRQLAMVLSYEHSGASLPAVGRRFKRDHTTVMHARHKITEIWNEDVSRAALAIMLSAHSKWVAARTEKITHTTQEART